MLEEVGARGDFVLEMTGVSHGLTRKAKRSRGRMQEGVDGLTGLRWALALLGAPPLSSRDPPSRRGRRTHLFGRIGLESVVFENAQGGGRREKRQPLRSGDGMGGAGADGGRVGRIDIVGRWYGNVTNGVVVGLLRDGLRPPRDPGLRQPCIKNKGVWR